MLLAITADNVSGFPSGAPFQSCNNGLLPVHRGSSPSTQFLPFTVNTTEFVGQTYIPNQLYTSEYSYVAIYVSNYKVAILRIYVNLCIIIVTSLLYIVLLQLGYMDSQVIQPFEDL